MMKLNCDLGESYGAWQMNHDDLLMPHVDMASIACGYHAGDPEVMENAIRFAKANDVTIGAHPSYPDRQGFGRRSLKMQRDEIIPMLHYQIAALDGMASVQGQSVQYVKPHGALYNDMMADPAVFAAVLEAVRLYPRNLPLVLQATADWQGYKDLADKASVSLLFEAFADRGYQDDGRLVPRTQPNAILPLDKILKRVDSLLFHNTIVSNNGKTLELKVDTLCVHGDSPDAIEAVKQIRARIQSFNQ